MRTGNRAISIFCVIRSFVRSFVRSLVRLFVRSFVRLASWLASWLAGCLVGWWPTGSLARWLAVSLLACITCKAFPGLRVLIKFFVHFLFFQQILFFSKNMRRPQYDVF